MDQYERAVVCFTEQGGAEVRRAWGSGSALFLASAVTTQVCLLSKHLLTCSYMF